MDPHPPTATRRYAWLGLFIALVVPFLGFAVAPQRPGTHPSTERLLWGTAIHWANAIALLAVVFLLERRDAASIGLKPLRRSTFPVGLLAAAAIFLVSPLAVYANRALGLDGDRGTVAYLMSLPFWLRALLVLTAGVFEEIAFRGYATERLGELTGRPRFAALVTWAAFTLGHAPAYGVTHLLPIAFVGALITGLYLWRRDLVVNIVAHAAFDGIGLLLLPAIVNAR